MVAVVVVSGLVAQVDVVDGVGFHLPMSTTVLSHVRWSAAWSAEVSTCVVFASYDLVVPALPNVIIAVICVVSVFRF